VFSFAIRVIPTIATTMIATIRIARTEVSLLLMVQFRQFMTHGSRQVSVARLPHEMIILSLIDRQVRKLKCPSGLRSQVAQDKREADLPGNCDRASEPAATSRPG